MIWVYWIALACFSGLLYRLGGIGKPWNTKYRDLGVAAIMVAAMAILGNFHWSLALCAGLLFASLTTYNKWVGYFCNRPDKTTVYWESWLVTGVFYGLAMLPFVVLSSHNYFGFGARCVLLGALTCAWSIAIGNDDLEEFGRGFFIIITLPLLF